MNTTMWDARSIREDNVLELKTKTIRERPVMPLTGILLEEYLTLEGERTAKLRAVKALRELALTSDPVTRAELDAIAETFQWRASDIPKLIQDIRARRPSV